MVMHVDVMTAQGDANLRVCQHKYSMFYLICPEPYVPSQSILGQVTMGQVHAQQWHALQECTDAHKLYCCFPVERACEAVCTAHLASANTNMYHR